MEGEMIPHPLTPSPVRGRGGDRSILVLSTADTDLLTLSHALTRLPDDFPRVRAVNPATLSTPEAASTFLDAELGSAGVVVARLLGGKRAFEHGWDRLIQACDERGVPVLAWRVARAFAVKLSAPTLDARTNEVAIESLEVRAAGISIIPLA